MSFTWITFKSVMRYTTIGETQYKMCSLFRIELGWKSAFIWSPPGNLDKGFHRVIRTGNLIDTIFNEIGHATYNQKKKNTPIGRHPEENWASVRPREQN